MSISPGTQWEYRSTGNNQFNGSGFDPAYGGVDASQQDAPTQVYTDLVSAAAPAPTVGITAQAVVGGAGGTIPAGTYYVVYTYAVNDLRQGAQKNGETVKCTAEVTVTLAGTGLIRITPPVNPGGCNAFRVYIGTVSGTNKLQARQLFDTTYMTFDRTHDFINYDAAGAAAPAASTLFNRISSVARPFVNNDLGNVLGIPANVANWAPQQYRYQIQGIAAGGVAIVDGVIANAAGRTAGQARLGGRTNAVTDFISYTQGGNTVWQKTQAGWAGTTTWDVQVANQMHLPLRLLGYDSFRGDNVRALLTTTGEFDFTGNGPMLVQNFDFLGGGSNTRLVLTNGTFVCIDNCIVRTAQNGIQATNSCLLRRCYIHHTKDAALIYNGGGSGYMQFCHLETPAAGGTGYGVSDAGGITILNCIINGFTAGYTRNQATLLSYIGQCVIDACTAGILFRDSINNRPGNLAFLQVRQSIFTNNTVAVRNDEAMIPLTTLVLWGWSCNAFYNNTTNYLNFPAGTDDTMLSADPYQDRAHGNFALNNVAGGGKSLRESSCVSIADGVNSVSGGIGFGGVTAISGAVDTPIQAFEEVQFPPTISRGAVGGPMFKTTVVITGSQSEQRVVHWTDPLYKWTIGRDLMTGADADTLVAFFVARNGKATGFRFKDWRDYSLAQVAAAAIDTTHFQIVKTYVSGAVTKTRKIKKPIAGTLHVYKSTDLTEVLAGFTVDYTTGVITYAVAPSYSPLVTCEFDVPVRFDTDIMEMTQVDVDVREWTSVPIVELRF